MHLEQNTRSIKDTKCTLKIGPTIFINIQLNNIIHLNSLKNQQNNHIPIKQTRQFHPFQDRKLSNKTSIATKRTSKAYSIRTEAALSNRNSKINDGRLE